MPSRESSRRPGVVYTRSWVVDFMLDLVGYDADQDLGAHTIVEPGCGEGAFLARVVRRLLASAETHGRPMSSLGAAIRAYELDPRAASRARAVTVDLLTQAGASEELAQRLAESWVVNADFLLTEHDSAAKWVVGNPPYVRVEDAEIETYRAYRSRWKTMTGRADLYVGFFEAGLSLLVPGGKLSFICADRWMHNQYGAALRRHVIEDFSLSLLFEIHQVDVFDSRVAAYPAITVMERSSHTSTALVTAKSGFGEDSVPRLRQWLSGSRRYDFASSAFSAAILEGRFNASASWPSGPPERLRLIADLEARLPTLTEVGVAVGVGIATGADRVYVVSDAAGVETELLKRAIGPADLHNGVVTWSGRKIVSPWKNGALIDLTDFPGVRRYFEQHAKTLRERYVGKRNPKSWWRTIDRPPADEYAGPKLIVADINDKIEPVLDVDGYWPLHSAYYITSKVWDLEALGGYLLSSTASAFVEAYSVKMASGHLRVSGQYLKKIRIPSYETVTVLQRNELISAFRLRDRDRASAVASAIVAGFREIGI